jgi:hypothetical protein
MRPDRPASGPDEQEMSFTDLFDRVDAPGGGPSIPTRKRLRRRQWLTVLALAVAAFALGALGNAVMFHFGHRTNSTGVVIGQQVNRPNPPSHPPARPKTPPSTAAPVTLAWAAPVSFDAGNAPQAVSCADSTLCAAVDAHGRAAVYEAGTWTAPVDVDGATPINSVACPDVRFCVAVDQSGDALTYNGSTWSHPIRVDKNSTFNELTSVSCASRLFCAAVDGDGNALVFDGTSWSAPQPADSEGAGPASRDVATVSCPVEGFCAGTDPSNDAFYLVGNSWQQATPIDTSTTPPALKYHNSIGCASPTFCVATENLGQVVAYNGTQWSVSVPIDPTNYVESLSCPEESFCAAVDGLLPEGFGAGNGSGYVVTYNGISWSSPTDIDAGGILQSISCPSRNFCMAVDQAGHAIAGTS